MSEELMQFSNRAGDELEIAAVVQISRKLERIYGKGIANLSRGVLDRLNILPDYVAAEHPEQFAKLRARLNQEPGVIISNHPNGFDAFPILAMLDRKDVLVFAAAPNNRHLENIFGKNTFIAQGEGPKDLQKALEKIEAHIRGGGLFLIFPSGGLEDDDYMEFKSGFQAILKRLTPTDMVYACKVNTDDAREMETRMPRGFGLIQALFDDGVVKHRQKTEKPLTVRVDERYTTAGEWQAALGDLRRKAGNEALSRHYEELFREAD